MTREVVMFIADDDAGPTRLIGKVLARAGFRNSTRRLESSQQMLALFFGKSDRAKFAENIKNPGLLNSLVEMPATDAAG